MAGCHPAWKPCRSAEAEPSSRRISGRQRQNPGAETQTLTAQQSKGGTKRRGAPRSWKRWSLGLPNFGTENAITGARIALSDLTRMPSRIPCQNASSRCAHRSSRSLSRTGRPLRPGNRVARELVPQRACRPAPGEEGMGRPYGPSPSPTWTISRMTTSTVVIPRPSPPAQTHTPVRPPAPVPRHPSPPHLQQPSPTPPKQQPPNPRRTTAGAQESEEQPGERRSPSTSVAPGASSYSRGLVGPCASLLGATVCQRQEKGRPKGASGSSAGTTLSRGAGTGTAGLDAPAPVFWEPQAAKNEDKAARAAAAQALPSAAPQAPTPSVWTPPAPVFWAPPAHADKKKAGRRARAPPSQTPPAVAPQAPAPAVWMPPPPVFWAPPPLPQQPAAPQVRASGHGSVLLLYFCSFCSAARTRAPGTGVSGLGAQPTALLAVRRPLTREEGCSVRFGEAQRRSGMALGRGTQDRCPVSSARRVTFGAGDADG